ncbi:MAG: hypothetical protein QGG40_00120 [Myxococcota bacterium]|nr:hypothetical protein [Myxococcota bacterium]
MAQFGDILNRMFAARGVRGLSGNWEPVLPGIPGLSFFDSRMRRHRCEKDLVLAPNLLWGFTGLLAPSPGLRDHLCDEYLDGPCDFTDVLVVISEADWKRIERIGRTSWEKEATRWLAQGVGELEANQGLQRPFESREFGFQFLRDGDPAMDETSLGLGRGQFVTATLPNRYTGPRMGSWPAVAVHLEIEGQWKGFREVGSLYADQVLFTIGGHWLDNFSHPFLDVPGLYRLHQHRGQLVHVLHPDFSDHYQIQTEEREGRPPIVHLRENKGRVVVRMILSRDEADHRPVDAGEPTEDFVVEPIEDISDPASFGGSTVIPVDVEDRSLGLRESGALLQKVHFSKVMNGYDVYLGPTGELGTALTDRAATFQVRGRAVYLMAHRVDVRVGGQVAPPGVPISLQGDQQVRVGDFSLDYVDLTGIQAKGWPYLGEVRRSGSLSRIGFGETHRLGRDRRCRIRLPDNGHNDNIVWLPELAQGGTIQARTGEIPKSHFYIDSIMVASEHLELDLRVEPRVTCIARHCFAFVRRGDRVLSLHPTRGRHKGGPHTVTLEEGDEILVGNCAFEVSLGDPVTTRDESITMIPDESVLRSQGPKPMLTPSFLAGAVDESEQEPPSVAGEQRRVVADGPPAASPRRPSPGPQADITRLGFLEDMIIDGPVPRNRSAGSAASPPESSPSSSSGAGRSAVDEPFGGPAPSAAVVSPPSRGAVEPFGGVEEPQPPVGGPRGATPRRGPVPLSSPGPDSDRSRQEDPSVRWTNTGVAWVEEARSQVELSRPARLVCRGWSLAGEIVVGNNRDAQVVLPENRVDPDQQFEGVDYFRCSVRGRRGRFEQLSSTELRASRDGQAIEQSDSFDGLELSVLRRDTSGEVDFEIPLVFRSDVALPNPRARLLEVISSDRLVQALFTIGIPFRSPRGFTLGPVRVDARFDGDSLILSNYLSTYRTDSGFVPFFVRPAAGSFHTVPEDGSPLTLAVGAEILVAGTLWVFQV